MAAIRPPRRPRAMRRRVSLERAGTSMSSAGDRGDGTCEVRSGSNASAPVPFRLGGRRRGRGGGARCVRSAELRHRQARRAGRRRGQGERCLRVTGGRPERGREVGGRRRAIGGIASQRVVEDGLQRGGAVAVGKAGDRRGEDAALEAEEGLARWTGERRPSGDDGEEGGRERVDVGPLGRCLSGEHLGRGVPRREVVERVGAVELRADAGDAEVGERRAERRQQDVLGLDVAVEDARRRGRRRARRRSGAPSAAASAGESGPWRATRSATEPWSYSSMAR